MNSNHPSDFSEMNITTGEIAKKLGINQRTLRIYDSENIAKPKRMNNVGKV